MGRRRRHERKTTVIDPVCGMSVDTATAEYRSFHYGKAYYFCSAGCKASFIAAVKITIQFFDGCQHWELAERRLRQAAADIGQEELQITYQRIDSPEDAERSDFHGSPTFLVNGRDPFGGGEAPA